MVLLRRMPDVDVETTPSEENLIADQLAKYGRPKPQLSLFFKGMELHHGLTEGCVALG